MLFIPYLVYILLSYMNTQELISIIVPVYNVEQYLPRCLETITQQTYRNLEIILVDDGSTDSSGQICDEFAKNDKRAIVIHQPNSGLWAARNTGQKKASGNYLMFVDGDDYMHQETIRLLYEALQNTEYDLAFVSEKQTSVLYEDVISNKEFSKSIVSQKELIHNIIKGKRTFCVVWNKLYRKSIVKDIWSNNYPRVQDVDFNLRVHMRINKAIWIQSELYYFVQRSDSLRKTSDYIFLNHLCWVKILFSNLVELPNNCKQYRGLLLKRLYRKMVFLKYGRWSSNDKVELCRKYEKATRKAYWLNWRINPLEKIVVTLLLHSPHLTRWLMKVTKNY